VGGLGPRTLHHVLRPRLHEASALQDFEVRLDLFSKSRIGLDVGGACGRKHYVLFAGKFAGAQLCEPARHPARECSLNGVLDAFSLESIRYFRVNLRTSETSG
jgi:hypothetical protein